MKKTNDNPDKEKEQHKVDELEKEIERVKIETEEWKGKYLRALADYQNLEKRAAQDKSEVRAFAAEIVLMKLLPIVDTFERAEAHLQDTGLSLALKEMGSFLASLGVTKSEVVGKPFYPKFMECIEVVEGKDNTVIELTRPGYTLNGKVIRVAQVKVGKRNTTNPTNE